MKTAKQTRVLFERPPIVEVACGVLFTLEQPLKTAHVGLYWSKVRDEFPRAEDAPPLPMTVETPTPGAIGQTFSFSLATMEPMRRAWLVSESGSQLVQVQEDRFHFNWKKTPKNEEYPSYVHVVAEFRKQWSRFVAFLREQGLGAPQVRQLEMTYFNQLPADAQFLVDHQRVGDNRFLPEPEAVQWRTQYFVPDLLGRLHVESLTGRNPMTGERVLRLDLTARGAPKEPSESTCEQWFDVAHEWITRGFADLTTAQAHKVWGRIS